MPGVINSRAPEIIVSTRIEQQPPQPDQPRGLAEREPRGAREIRSQTVPDSLDTTAQTTSRKKMNEMASSRKWATYVSETEGMPAEAGRGIKGHASDPQTAPRRTQSRDCDMRRRPQIPIAHPQHRETPALLRYSPCARRSIRAGPRQRILSRSLGGRLGGAKTTRTGPFTNPTQVLVRLVHFAPKGHRHSSPGHRPG